MGVTLMVVAGGRLSAVWPEPGQAGSASAGEPERALRRGDGDRLLYIIEGCRRHVLVGERFPAKPVELGFKTVAVGLDDVRPS